MSDHWIQIHQEREALGELLPSFTAEQWNTPSLCEGWSVRDVVAHQIDSYERELFPFVSGLIQTKGNMDKLNQEALEHIRDTPDDALIARYRIAVDRRTKPPVPTVFVLAEALVHNQDIMRPLKIDRQVPLHSVLDVANLYRRIGYARKWRHNCPNVKLVASDTSWEYGEGEVATAPLLSIVMMLAGRSEFTKDFTGPGAERLQLVRSS